MPAMKLSWSDYFLHWLNWRCGAKLVREGGEVRVRFDCPVCAKESVTPEAWERLRIEKEQTED